MATFTIFLVALGICFSVYPLNYRYDIYTKDGLITEARFIGKTSKLSKIALETELPNGKYQVYFINDIDSIVSKKTGKTIYLSEKFKIKNIEKDSLTTEVERE